MIPVFQRSAVDCFSACVASVLEISIEESPFLWEYTGNEWVWKLQEWAANRGLGICYFSLKNREDWPILDGFHCIVAGTTHRSKDYQHCIVAKASTDRAGGNTRLEFVHDPCREGGYVTDPEFAIFFVRP